MHTAFSIVCNISGVKVRQLAKWDSFGIVRCGMRPSRRRRSGQGTIPPSPQKQCSSVSNGESADGEVDITTETLALMLDGLRENLAKENIDSVDLAGFDMKTACETMEFLRRREEVKHMMGSPKAFDEKIDLNYDVAVIGGAKLFVDQTRTTRSISKKLVSYCGLNENEFLYGGLDRGHSEMKAVEEINKNRQSSVLESFVDFQKQIQFKMSVLNHVAKKVSGGPSKSYPRVANVLIKGNSFKTPAHKGYINPLDSRRIVESYALEVASQVAGRSRKRRIVGIPFNIHLLDDEEG
uniref:Uncharacterized protein n=1 Tax=Parascaris univalens TaxID=6257 RepID=A0A915AHG4_PARUN